MSHYQRSLVLAPILRNFARASIQLIVRDRAAGDSSPAVHCEHVEEIGTGRAGIRRIPGPNRGPGGRRAVRKPVETAGTTGHKTSLPAPLAVVMTNTGGGYAQANSLCREGTRGKAKEAKPG